MRLSRQRSRGLSLIEILITLAIFVIGILAVLRIFPQGLGTLARVSEEQEALRLAEARMNQLRAESGRLPDYLLPAGAPTDTIGFLDPPTNATANPGFGFLQRLDGTEQYRPYDLDLPFADATDTADARTLHRLLANDRLVVGERVVVGRRQTAAGAVEARPALTIFGPIARATDTAGAPLSDGAGNPLPALAVFRPFGQITPLELQRTVVGGAYRDRPVFAVVDGGIDPFTGVPAADRLLLELDAADRLLAIRCAWRDNVGTVRWAQLAPVLVPGRAAGAATSRYEAVPLSEPLAPYAAITNVIASSVQVKQVIEPAPTQTRTPARFTYHYQDFPRGVLYFATSQAGETLQLEYLVDDWRNLLVDLTVGVENNGGSYEIAAADLVQPDPAGQPGLWCLQLEDRNLDETVTPLLVAPAGGQQLAVNTAAWTGDPGLARQGLIPLQSRAWPEPLAGPRQVRVIYRKVGNWAVVPALAPSAYILEADAVQLVSGDFPVKNILVGATTTTLTNAAGQTLTRLEFRPSEAGRAIAVSYEVETAAGRELVVGELHVVPTQANLNTAGARDTWRHTVLLKRGNVALDGNGRPVIHNVEGRSLQLRVVYDEDSAGREAEPVRTPAAPGVTYSVAERLVELGTYVRRER